MDKKNDSISSGEKNQKLDSSKDLNSEKSKSNSNQKEKSDDSSVPHPLPLKLNKVKNRLLFLSPTVRTGIERECNKNDFFREGDSYIGKGAFGEVWKVSHRQTNKIYVINV